MHRRKANSLAGILAFLQFSFYADDDAFSIQMLCMGVGWTDQILGHSRPCRHIVVKTQEFRQVL